MESKALQFLSQIAPFNFLPQEELEKIARVLRVANYPENTILCVQGQTQIENLYIIYKGALELYYQENGHKSLSGYLGEGETFGGISILVNDGYAVRTVRVQEKTALYLLSGVLFKELCSKYPEFLDFFTNALGKRMVDKSYKAIIAKMASQRNGASPPLFNRQVAHITNSQFAYCDQKSSLQQAAALMNRHKQSCILIKDEQDKFVGIVTDRDFREKVVAGGLDLSTPVSEVMSSPLITIPANSPAFEAILLMVQKNIKHLAVTDNRGNVIGVTSNKRLMMAQGQSPVLLIRDIQEASAPEALFSKHEQIPILVKDLVQGGGKADHLNRMITAISDAILLRLIEFALEKHGPPPVNFVFMIMGSEGRKEQTLKTDQDNAIIYEDVPQKAEKETRSYFLKFAKTVCGWLDKAGYSYCKGEVMAQNPKWCQPLSVWKEYFRTWVHTPEPMAVMHSTIFFDFKSGYGDSSITEELRGYLFELLDNRAGLFFYHLANNALKLKPPLGFFRNFVVESRGEHRDSFDIKKAMTPIVDFARSYALENKIEATNTLERLSQLYWTGVLKEQEYNELVQSYRYLMQIRLVRQVTAIIDEQHPPDNYVNPEKLTHIEQKMLKEIFQLVSDYQKKLSMHFTGSV